MKISEIFGPTIQGEGSAAGRHCLFVRLADCNLECTWCDTPYTWAFNLQKASKTESKKEYDPEVEIEQLRPDQVLAKLAELWPIERSPTLVVVSGGEPLMQQPELAVLAGSLADLDCPVHIETAGTINPTVDVVRHVNQFNVSPKLAHSGNRTSKRYKPSVLTHFGTLNSWFKFVVRDREDFEEIDQIVAECRLRPERVMVMPEGTYSEDNITTAKKIIDPALARGYGLTFRSHVFLWGDTRGK